MKTIAVCLAALLCGCSITGHLERRQYCADVLHVSREQREREQQTYQPPALKIEWDSNRFYLVPTEVQENGERIMAMQIQQVTIRAKARTLPERLGKVIIDFVIDMPRQLQGACRSVIVTPICTSTAKRMLCRTSPFGAGCFHGCSSATTGSSASMSGLSHPTAAPKPALSPAS